MEYERISDPLRCGCWDPLQDWMYGAGRREHVIECGRATCEGCGHIERAPMAPTKPKILPPGTKDLPRV